MAQDPNISMQQVLLNRLRGNLDEPSAKQKIGLPKIETFDLDGAGPTIVPHPPQWQPYPEVIGGHGLARILDQLMSVAPALQGRIKSVQYGPNKDVLNQLAPDFRAPDFEITNLLGLTNMESGRIALNPRLDDMLSRYGDPSGVGDPNALEVLGHEATHAAGYAAERTPEDTGNLIRQLTGTFHYARPK